MKRIVVPFTFFLLGVSGVQAQSQFSGLKNL
jgi:hypothetical protein